MASVYPHDELTVPQRVIDQATERDPASAAAE
jgi:hypothetical protein